MKINEHNFEGDVDYIVVEMQDQHKSSHSIEGDWALLWKRGVYRCPNSLALSRSLSLFLSLFGGL